MIIDGHLVGVRKGKGPARSSFKKGHHSTTEFKEGHTTNKGKHFSFSKERNSKISKSLIGKTPWNIGIPRTEEEKKKMSMSKVGRPSPRKGCKLSKETKEKIRQRKIGKKLVFKNPEERNRKNRDWHILNPNRKYSNTSIEKLICTELICRGYVENKDFFRNVSIHNIKNVDFWFPKFNILIECDGCYYHNCLIHHPNCHKDNRKKDELITQKLQEEGYSVYRLWEHDIKISAKNCIDTISQLK